MAKERKFIPRKQFRFWLICDSQLDQILMEHIAFWKEHRQFTEMIKGGIRLMWSLGKGELDVLFELFPQLETQLAARYAPPAPDTSSLEVKIERLELALLQLEGRNLPDTRDHGIPAAKPYGHAAITAPVATITAAKVATADEIADNFMAQLWQ